jgi:hypothetical protein
MMLVGALAFFTLVSGRFTTTSRLYKRIQAMCDAESASFVTYQLIGEGTVTHPEDVSGTKTYNITYTNGKKVRMVLSSTAHGSNPNVYPIQATSLE